MSTRPGDRSIRHRPSGRPAPRPKPREVSRVPGRGVRKEARESGFRVVAATSRSLAGPLESETRALTPQLLSGVWAPVRQSGWAAPGAEAGPRAARQKGCVRGLRALERAEHVRGPPPL